MSSENPLHRILVVDDARFIRAVVQQALTLGGNYTVEVCESGFDALARAPAVNPDLILLDVVMPDLDGPATLQALRALPGLAATPVVFLTAESDLDKLDALRALGAVDVINKSFDPSDLADQLEAIWASVQHAQPGPSEEDQRSKQLAASMERLRTEYVETLPGKIATMKRFWKEAFDDGTAPAANMDALYIAAHNMHGSAAAFRFDRIAEISGRFEKKLTTLIQADEPVGVVEQSLIRGFLRELEQAADAATEPAPGTETEHFWEEAERVIDLAPPSEALGEAKGSRLRLLVVDDMEVVCRRFALALGAAGFDVDEARDGITALRLARQQRYDLVLMDLNMPGLDGFETQRRLRRDKATHTTPVMFMTATSAVNLKQVQEAMGLGVSGFVPKSLPMPQVIRKICDVIERGVSPAGRPEKTERTGGNREAAWRQ